MNKLLLGIVGVLVSAAVATRGGAAAARPGCRVDGRRHASTGGVPGTGGAGGTGGAPGAGGTAGAGASASGGAREPCQRPAVRPDGWRDRERRRRGWYRRRRRRRDRSRRRTGTGGAPRRVAEPRRRHGRDRGATGTGGATRAARDERGRTSATGGPRAPAAYRAPAADGHRGVTVTAGRRVRAAEQRLDRRRSETKPLGYGQGTTGAARRFRRGEQLGGRAGGHRRLRRQRGPVPALHRQVRLRVHRRSVHPAHLDAQTLEIKNVNDITCRARRLGGQLRRPHRVRGQQRHHPQHALRSVAGGGNSDASTWRA